MGWVCCCVVHLKGASLLTETSPALCSAHTQVIGAKVKDLETGETFDVSAKVVINAAGPFVDSLCGMADKEYMPMVCLSLCVLLFWKGAAWEEGRCVCLVLQYATENVSWERRVREGGLRRCGCVRVCLVW